MEGKVVNAIMLNGHKVGGGKPAVLAFITLQLRMGCLDVNNHEAFVHLIQLVVEKNSKTLIYSAIYLASQSSNQGCEHQLGCKIIHLNCH